MNPTSKPSDTTSDTRLRVRRGGSLYNREPSWVSAACRITFVPAVRSYVIGFRCALRGREPLKVTP